MYLALDLLGLHWILLLSCSKMALVRSDCPEVCKCYEWPSSVYVHCHAPQIQANHTLTLNIPFMTIHLSISDINVSSFRYGVRETLRNLTNLELLRMVNNNLGELQKGFVNPLKMRELFVNKNGLKQVPVLLLAQLYNLTSLQLKDNEIEFIPSNAFVNNSKLQLIDLTGNIISSIHGTAFVGNGILKFLVLSANKINNFTSLLFVNLRKLNYLQLDSNTMADIPLYMLSQNVALVSMNFTFNNLSRLSMDLFVNLKNLTYAYFRKNQIKDVLPSKSSFVLDKLSYLDMSDNKLTSVPVVCFQSMPRMGKVNLRNNRITIVENDSFSELHFLKSLLLENNRITVIDDGAFGGLYSIEHIDISYNNVTRLTNSLIAEHDFSFDFRRNPIICDCELFSIYKWILKSSFHQPLFICEEPPQLNGIELMNSNLSVRCSDFEHPTDEVTSSTLGTLTTPKTKTDTNVMPLYLATIVLFTIIAVLDIARVLTNILRTSAHAAGGGADIAL